MRILIAFLIPSAILFTGCNKLKDHPDLIGVWGSSVQLSEGHTMLISDEGTGYPLQSSCNGTGTLKVKLTDNELDFKKNGSTRMRYTISIYPQTASEMIIFNTQSGCLPVETISDTIYPGETYMVLNETIYVKKRP